VVLGQERSPQPPVQVSGIGLPPIAVTQNKKNPRQDNFRVFIYLFFVCSIRLKCRPNHVRHRLNCSFSLFSFARAAAYRPGSDRRNGNDELALGKATRTDTRLANCDQQPILIGAQRVCDAITTSSPHPT